MDEKKPNPEFEGWAKSSRRIRSEGSDAGACTLARVKANRKDSPQSRTKLSWLSWYLGLGGKGARVGRPVGKALRGGLFRICCVESRHALDGLFVIGLEAVAIAVELMHHDFGGEAAAQVVLRH